MKVPFALSDASPLFMLILLILAVAVVTPYFIALARHHKRENADADKPNSDNGG